MTPAGAALATLLGLKPVLQIQGGKLVRVHQTSMADGAYDDAVDYTTMAF